MIDDWLVLTGMYNRQNYMQATNDNYINNIDMKNEKLIKIGLKMALNN